MTLQHDLGVLREQVRILIAERDELRATVERVRQAMLDDGYDDGTCCEVVETDSIYRAIGDHVEVIGLGER